MELDRYMKLLCKNTEHGLIPLYPSDFEEKKKLKLNEVYSFEIKKERNYEFLKKFMALCKVGMLNSKYVEMPLNTYRKYATIKAGYYEIYQTPKGNFVEAKSISFAKMTEEEFQEVYNRVLDFIIIDTEATKEDIEKNLLNFF